MTKMKNTKKGMAKKTLSISLAVAMLATSNVPVWAAEFSDGSDVAFTSEAVVEEAPAAEVVDEAAEAPVVEDEAAPVAEDSSISKPSGDLAITEKGWANRIKPSGKLYDTDGNEFTGNCRWAWVVDGKIGNTFGTDWGYGSVASIPNYAPAKEDIGKTVQLRVYEYATTEIGNDRYVYATNTVEVSKANVELDSVQHYISLDINGQSVNHQVKYNGKQQYVKDFANVNAFAGFENGYVNLDRDDFDYTCTLKEGNGIDVESVYTIKATPKDTDLYTGSLLYDYKVVAKDWEVGDLKVYLNKTSYEYTGDPIIPAPEDVTVIDNLSGKTLDSSEVIKEITTTGGKNVGNKVHGVHVTLQNVPNFTDSSIAGLDYNNEYSDKGQDGSKLLYSVTPRDLSNVDIKVDTIAYDGKVLQDNDWRFMDNIHIFDKATGEELNLVQRTDYTVHVSGSPADGTKVYDIEIKAANGNTTGFQKLTFTLGNETFAHEGYKLTDDALNYLTSAVSYTGKDIVKDTSKVVFKKGNTVLSPENYEVKVYGLDSGKRAGKVVITGLKSYEGCEEVYYFDIEAAEVTSVTAAAKVVYVKGYTDADQYAPAITVTAKSKDKTVTFTLKPEDYKVSYRFATTNMIGEKIISRIQITNKNFKGGKLIWDCNTEIAKRNFANVTAVAEPGSYTYTGAVVKPTLKVMDGEEPLTEGVDYEVVSYKHATDVGTATVTIKGIGNNNNPADGIYDNTATKDITYEITPANAEDIKVEFAAGNTGVTYTGNVIKPTIYKVTLNGNDVSKQFDYVYPSTNVNVGTGHVILKPVYGNKNFTGQKDAEFQITPAELKGELKVYDENGVQYTVRNGILYKGLIPVFFAYDGKEHTFAKAEFIPGKGMNSDLAKHVTADDYEIVYIDNVYGKTIANEYTEENFDGIAHIAVVGKGNFVGGAKVTDASENVISVVNGADYKFGIKKYTILKQHVTIEDGEFAAGQPVRPNVTVVVGGQTLVENRDYKLLYNAISDLTNGKTMDVEIQGINGYKGQVFGKWGVGKCNMANTQVVLTTGKKPEVTVYNAGVKIPASEYTVAYEKDYVVVTAKEGSKYYTGSTTAEYVAVDSKPATPIISGVKVDGNTATVMLENNVADGARGYDYVISTDPNCITSKAYDDVIKNQLRKDVNFQYVQEGVYYAYCHSWVRNPETNEKIFSDWSNAGRFEVYAQTPAQPKITSVKANKGTVTVTYTATEGATGYDVVLGSEVKKVGDAGEKRPVNYGTLVKKNIKGNVVTATFKNVPAGTYYAGLHAFNRSRVDGKKVFSPWSQAKKVVVK